MTCHSVMFASRPWSSTTGSGWAALGLQDQLLAPGGEAPGVRIPAVMPEASVGGVEEEPLDAAAVALEQSSSRATTTNSRPTDRAARRIIRREPCQPTPMGKPEFPIAHGALWAFMGWCQEPSRQRKANAHLRLFLKVFMSIPFPNEGVGSLYR